MGNNLNCFSGKSDDQDLYRDPANLTPSRAAVIIQNEFRRGKASQAFQNKIIDNIKLQLSKNENSPPSIDIITIEEFQNKLNTFPEATTLIDKYSKSFDATAFCSSEVCYKLMPLKFTHSDTDKEDEYYYGEWNINGITSGQGTLITNNGNIYKGNFSSGMFNGIGLFIHSNGDYYFGDWVNNECNGKGSLIIKDVLQYDGDFVNNCRHGHGIEKYPDKSYYEGDFVQNEKEGKGKNVYPDGSYYIGDFKKSLYNGEGEYFWNDGRVYKGGFVKGAMEGKAIHKWGDGSWFSGYYVNNKKQGEGVYVWPNGKKVVGTWVNNEPNGNGYCIIGDKKYDIVFRFGKVIASRSIQSEDTDNNNNNNNNNSASIKNEQEQIKQLGNMEFNEEMPVQLNMTQPAEDKIN